MSEGSIKWENYLQVASLTDLGMRRTNNQDNFCSSLASNMDHWSRRGHLFIVADGMGAHAAGELASKIAVDHIPHLYGKYRDMPAPEGLRRAIVDANTEIHRRGQANEEFHHMGTTCSTLVILPEGAFAAHVGDSRVYRLRGTRLEQLTFDHSLVWEMQAAGQLTGKDDLIKIPKNVITRSLGPYPEVNVDLEGPFPVEVGDTFLLCSDGLSGQMSDAEIGAVLAALPPNEAARVMVDIANIRGGPDNSTVIIVRIQDAKLAHGTKPAANSSNSRSNKTHPLMWGLVGCAFILAILFQVTTEKWMVSVIPAAIGIIALLVIVIAKSSASAGSLVPAGQRPRFGKGPHTQTECATSGWDLVHKLKEIIEQIKQESKIREWKIDEKKLAELIAVGETAGTNKDLRGSIRHYSLATSFLMEQIRNQAGGSGTSIDL